MTDSPFQLLQQSLLNAGCNPKRNGTGWQASCPVPDHGRGKGDRSPSLSFGQDNQGNAWVKCFVGCSTEQVLSALDLEKRDLFQKKKPDKKIEATYSYQDAEGKLLFEVVRFIPKGFVQRRPNPDKPGEWIWNLKGINPVLYHLPDIIDKTHVICVEGEKDADKLWKLGIPATCNPMGAGKWKDCYSKSLSDKTIYIIPDNDNPGLQHALSVAQSLVNTDAIVHLLDPFEDAKDVSEWLGKAHTKEELKDLFRKSNLFDPDNIPAWANDLEEVQTQGNNGSTALSWGTPEPLPSELPQLLPFDHKLLPDKFQPWAIDISERMQAPIDFIAVGIMIAFSAVVGKGASIQPKCKDDWTVIPNLFGAVIAPPGAMKTPALSEVMKPLKRLENQAAEEYEEILENYEYKLTAYKALKTERETEIRKAAKEGKDTSELVRNNPPPEEPIAKRFIVNDGSIEKIGELLQNNPNGLLVYRDELSGLLKSLDKQGSESSRAFYLESWNGDGNFIYDRIGRGTIRIKSCCLSILGGIQPGVLQEYIRQAIGSGAGADGLLQRFQLMVYPDISKDWELVDRWADTDAKNTAFEIFTWAANIPEKKDSYRFDEYAQDLFYEWWEELELRLRKGEELPALEAHLSKYRSLVPSIALLSHLADNKGEGKVTIEALQKAIGWSEYLESHARKVYSSVVQNDIGTAYRIAEKINGGSIEDCFSIREIYRNGWAGLGNRKEVEQGLEILEDYEWVRSERVPTGGKSKIVYHLNPELI
ncbi:MAG: DUF3987 domain-containing protein [Candidatus Electryonea clarkiae]|nr:DUF3987 domain-containing protein [Candidatus Electryonea clarkiae]